MFDFYNAIAKVFILFSSINIFIYIYHCIGVFFSVLQQSLYVCLIKLGKDRWVVGTCLQLSMYFYITCIYGCHIFAPKDSKWYSLVHSFVPNLTHLYFFSNWVDLLPNLTHFEKTISSSGKDLVQKNGLT